MAAKCSEHILADQSVLFYLFCTFCTKTSISRNNLTLLYLTWFNFAKENCHTLYILIVSAVVLFCRKTTVVQCLQSLSQP